MINYPTNRDTADWFPDQIARLNTALEKAGVPREFRRYQEPVGYDDARWLRGAAQMWKRSYEVAEYANGILRAQLRQAQWLAELRSGSAGEPRSALAATNGEQS